MSKTEELRKGEQNNRNRVPLVDTYHPDLPYLSIILREYLPTLHVLEKIKQAVPSPLLVANWLPKSLKDFLVRASMKPPQQNHESNNQCGRPIVRPVC